MTRRRRSTGTAGEHDVIGTRNGPARGAPAVPDLFSSLPKNPPPNDDHHLDRMLKPVRPPHASGSDTSLAAAEHIRGDRHKTLLEQVYQAIASEMSRGLTRKEGTTLTRIPPNVFTPRVLELLEAGRIVEGRHKRGTPGGHVLQAAAYAPRCPGCGFGNPVYGQATCNRCNSPNATT